MARIPTDEIGVMHELAKSKLKAGNTRMNATVTTIMQLCENLKNERKLKELFANDYVEMRGAAEKVIVEIIKTYGGNPVFFKLATILGIHLAIPVCFDDKEPNALFKEPPEEDDANIKNKSTKKGSNISPARG